MKAGAWAARPASMSPARSGWRATWDRDTRSSPFWPITGRAISPSCSIRNSSARSGCRCRPGWNGDRAYPFRTRRHDTVAVTKMPTDCLFRDDAYRQDCGATVLDVTDRGVVLDRTVFYATSGGQPGDGGVLLAAGASEMPVAVAVYLDGAKTEVAHVLDGAAARPEIGASVTARIGWTRRYARMRMHTALHLLSAVLPYPV